MSQRVLMVDDEEDLVWSLTRQMRRERPELDFEGLCDPEQALARIAEAPPDVLVTDVRMPKMNGLELLLAARRVVPNLPVVVVTAYSNADVRLSVLRTPSVQYLEKPFAFTALLAAVEKALTPPAGFSGAISLPMLPDLIQLYALARMSGALNISRGSARGTIWFEHGDIVHAEHDGARGAEAFFGLLRWEGGAFTVDTSAAAPEHSITASWQELLVDGLRRIDEEHRQEAGPHGPAAEGGTLGGDARLQALQAALAPLVASSAPEAWVVAVRLASGSSVTLHGSTDAAPWSRALGQMLEVLDRIAPCAQRGGVECLAPDTALAASWDRDADLALVFGCALEGRSGAARFRSVLARWLAACAPWLDGSERQEPKA